MSEHQEFLPPPPAEEEMEQLVQDEKKEEQEIKKEEMEQLVQDEQEIKEVEMEQLVQDVKTLGSIVQLIVASNASLEKYKMDVSPKTKLILEKLLGEHQYFEKVEEYILTIIKDDKLDAKDVPIVMLLLTELYARLESFSLGDIKSEDCANVLKIIFEIALQEKVVPISDENMEVASSIFNIIDTSVTLIQTKNNLDEGVPSKQGLLYCLTHYICNIVKGDKNEDE